MRDRTLMLQVFLMDSICYGCLLQRRKYPDISFLAEEKVIFLDIIKSVCQIETNS